MRRAALWNAWPAWLALALCAVVLVVGASRVISTCTAEGVECDVTSGGVGMLLAAAGAGTVGFLIGVLALWRRHPRRSAFICGAGLALGGALLASTPVQIAWQNCNHMSGTMAAGVAVPTLLFPPEDIHLSFDGYSTLKACSRLGAYPSTK
jgi:hypothetical protein